MPSKSKLTFEQIELVAQSSDAAYDYPKLTFDQVAKKALGPKPLSNAPNSRAFRREAKAVWDQERRPWAAR